MADIYCTSEIFNTFKLIFSDCLVDWLPRTSSDIPLVSSDSTQLCSEACYDVWVQCKRDIWKVKIKQSIICCVLNFRVLLVLFVWNNFAGTTSDLQLEGYSGLCFCWSNPLGSLISESPWRQNSGWRELMEVVSDASSSNWSLYQQWISWTCLVQG